MVSLVSSCQPIMHELGNYRDCVNFQKKILKCLAEYIPRIRVRTLHRFLRFDFTKNLFLCTSDSDESSEIVTTQSLNK